MSKKVVVGGSDVTFGLLEDLMSQLKSGVKTNGEKGLTGDQLRAFLEHRNPFKITEIHKILPYADEVVKSNVDYPTGFEIKSPEAQLEIWQRHFPDFDSSYVLELAQCELPDEAEGWGVFPKPSKVGADYYVALEQMLNLLAKDRKFKNWREGQLDEKHLRLTEQTDKALRELVEETPGDYLVIPFQFGKKWRGCSVRHAQVRFGENEFGLGPFKVAALLVTHPDRITGPNQLYIDCVGCEYDPNADEQFQNCLGFHWSSDHGCLDLGCVWFGYHDPDWGSVSGFRVSS